MKKISYRSLESFTGLMNKVMVVHAHPDDETIFTGHIIAHALRLDAEVKLVTLTHGEGSSTKNPKLRSLNQSSADMAAYRSNALLGAVAEFEGLEHSFFGTRAYLETNQGSVGITKLFDRDPLYPLTLTGSGMTVVAEELVPVLKRFRPDTIVTLSSNDTNSDHKMAFKSVKRAIKLLRTSRPPKHFVVHPLGTSGDISIGDEYTASIKRKAMEHYGDFATFTSDSFDFGAGAIKFSTKETLSLVR